MELLAELAHANLVRYYGADLTHENDVITLNLIMEHVGGGSLRTKIQQFSPLPLDV